jgi:hypothetical protein
MRLQLTVSWEGICFRLKEYASFPLPTTNLNLLPAPLPHPPSTLSSWCWLKFS